MEVKSKQLAAAIELYKSAENDGSRERAIGIMEEIASGDDVSACLILGVNFDPAKEKGFTRRDEAKSLRWYEKAAELGDAKGANEAAILCFRGGAEIRDKAMAEKYIRMAVDIDPYNDTYRKNRDIISSPAAGGDSEADLSADGSPSADAGCGGGSAPVITGKTGGMSAFNIACGVLAAAWAVLFAVLKPNPAYLAGIAALFIFAVYMNLRLGGCSVSVTGRMISGRRSFRRTVAVPVDSISSVGAGAFGGVIITAPSCTASFYLIKNADAVYAAVAGLLDERQAQSSARPNGERGPAVELSRLSELLDAGYMTRDEFDLLKDGMLVE